MREFVFPLSTPPPSSLDRCAIDATLPPQAGEDGGDSDADIGSRRPETGAMLLTTPDPLRTLDYFAANVGSSKLPE